MACCGQGAMLLALKAGEIKRRSRFQRSPSEKKTPSIMPSALWIKEPHVASRLPGGQRTRVNEFKKKFRPRGPLLQSSLFSTTHLLNFQKMPGFTALKGRISKILEVSGHEVKHTILVPALGLRLVGKSDACFFDAI